MVPRTLFILAFIFSVVIALPIDCDPSDDSCTHTSEDSTPLVPRVDTADIAEIYSTKDNKDMSDAIHMMEGLSKSDKADFEMEKLSRKQHMDTINKRRDQEEKQKMSMRRMQKNFEKELSSLRNQIESINQADEDEELDEEVDDFTPRRFDSKSKGRSTHRKYESEEEDEDDEDMEPVPKKKSNKGKNNKKSKKAEKEEEEVNYDDYEEAENSFTLPSWELPIVICVAVYLLSI